MPIPIADVNPTHKSHRSMVTFVLIALNIIIFVVVQKGLFGDVTDESLLRYGLIPSVLWGQDSLPQQFQIFYYPLTAFTHSFLHGDLFHLITNLVILWVFGDNIEQAFGRVGYLVFYLAGGLAAGLLHAFVESSSAAPLIGASGAISAIGAAYLLLHPRAVLWVLLFWLIPIKMPAWAAIGAWFVYQIYSSLVAGDQLVAWWAHIGGFVFGVAYIYLFKRRFIDAFYRQIFDRS
jgi:membrane associated rhomboid family serine protease